MLNILNSPVGTFIFKALKSIFFQQACCWMVQMETALQKESTHLKLDDINNICSLLLQVEIKLLMTIRPSYVIISTIISLCRHFLM